MDTGTISLVILAGMCALLAIGMPLGLASGALAVATLLMKFGPDLLFRSWGTGPFNILSQGMYGLATDYVLLSVPLFLLMATLLERSGIAREMYNSLSILLGRVRGGVGVVTIVMAVILASMSGIIGGEIVMLGLVALPQMLRLGYDRNIAVGTICASGSLAALIPPSIVLIIYGSVAETSIKGLFTAAIIPGLMLALGFMLYVLVRVWLNPALAPLPVEEVTWKDKLRALPGLLRPAIVGTVVLGSIYGGITGITEAAAMGTAVALLMILIRGELTFAVVWEALNRTLLSTGSILWVSLGATALAGAYAIVGGPNYIANLIVGLELPPMLIIVMMMLIFLFLGTLLDWIGIVLLAMPVFLPILARLPVDELGLLGGLDPKNVAIWFGILFCVNMQVSFLSPPFAPAAFYLKSVAPPEITLAQIFYSFLPFMAIQTAVLFILVMFPEITQILL